MCIGIGVAAILAPFAGDAIFVALAGARLAGTAASQPILFPGARFAREPPLVGSALDHALSNGPAAGFLSTSHTTVTASVREAWVAAAAPSNGALDDWHAARTRCAAAALAFAMIEASGGAEALAAFLAQRNVKVKRAAALRAVDAEAAASVALVELAAEVERNERARALEKEIRALQMRADGDAETEVNGEAGVVAETDGAAERSQRWGDSVGGADPRDVGLVSLGSASAKIKFSPRIAAPTLKAERIMPPARLVSSQLVSLSASSRAYATAAAVTGAGEHESQVDPENVIPSPSQAASVPESPSLFVAPNPTPAPAPVPAVLKSAKFVPAPKQGSPEANVQPTQRGWVKQATWAAQEKEMAEAQNVLGNFAREVKVRRGLTSATAGGGGLAGLATSSSILASTTGRSPGPGVIAAKAGRRFKEVGGVSDLV